MSYRKFKIQDVRITDLWVEEVLAVPSTHGVKVTGLGFLPIAESVEVGEIL